MDQRIREVEPGSIGQELGLEPGDVIASINGDWTGVQGTLYWNEYNEATVDLYWVQWQADGTRRIVDILPASSYAAN